MKSSALQIMFSSLPLLMANAAFAQTDLSKLTWGLNNQGKPQQLAIDHYTSGNVLGVVGEDVRLPAPAVNARTVIVGVLDTGADFTHPQLKNILIGKGFNAINGSMDATDAHGHGTHISGIIAAEPNGSGFQGVSQHVRILPVKVIQTGPNAPIRPQSTEPGGGTALTENVAKGLIYAIENGAEVINLSMAWPAAIRSKNVDDAMALAKAKNVIIVSSAGNDGTTANVYPCIYENVICVGAQGPDGAPAHFSNYGSMVDLLAPGTAILSTWPMNKAPVTFAGQVGYEFRNGTSMSAPFVTGALAELLSRGYSPTEAKNRLLLGARRTSDHKLFSSDIVGTYTHDTSNEVKSIRFGNLDLTQAIAVKPSPLILPSEKGLIELPWDGNTTEAVVAIDWTNRWLSAGQTQISVNGQTFSFSKIAGQSKVTTSVRIKLGKNPDSVQHLSASVSTRDYEKQNIEISIQLIRPLTAANLPKEASIGQISGVTVSDYSDLRSVVNIDSNARLDLILARSTETSVQLALVQDHQYFASAEIKDFKMDQFLKFYRLPDQSYVAIFTKPDPKVTRPDFFIERFDSKFKFVSETVLGTDTTVLPENFQWMLLKGTYTLIFSALGFTPPLDLPKYDPWNPEASDIKTPRIYYLDGNDLRIVPMANNQYPLQILTDGRILIAEGNSYYMKYKLLTLADGKISRKEELHLAEYRMLVGLEAGLPVLDLKGAPSNSLAVSGASSPGNLRTTSLGQSTVDQILNRSTILDALMNVSGVFSDLFHQYYFVQTHYDLVLFTSGSDQTISTSLNRYSYIPSMNFTRSFNSTVIRDENGNGVPGIYIPASIANANTAEVIVADLAHGKMLKPAKFRIQVQDPNCTALGNLVRANVDSPAQQVFVCGNTLIKFPLQY